MPTQEAHLIKDYVTEKEVRTCLHENGFFRITFNGRFHYLDAVKYARGVAIVPRFKNGDLLLVQLRRARAIGLSREIPRGGSDAGETVQQGPVRELLEETGYTVEQEPLRFLGRLGADTATLNGLMEVYLVEITDDAVAGEFDTEEIEKPVRMSE
ncbi:NUDIX hydrolase [Burkholderia cenocepacia]|uniref:NUDIX hydrolase n=1 Tax=Burkholderia cenocepacia TaxID=95486 RepID=UPI000761703B|nr:NUDIX domain-containing protein [Burkholderia cenocepacia]KWU19128.1 hypothetical protein AS149_12840 [Burkholderia cenocepacia]